MKELKKFLEKKKKDFFSVELKKGDSCVCDTCGKEIFGNDTYSGCICYGNDAKNKVFVLRKSDNSIVVKFPKSWDEENMLVFMEILKKKRGNYVK
jgi:hypothetical protein